MTALQGLQVYPVAGSQVGFFAFMIPGLAIVGLWDAGRELPEQWRWPRPISGLSTAAAAGLAFWALSSLGPVWPRLPSQLARFRSEEVELGLPGAQSLRLPESEAMAFCWLSANLRHHGDTLLGEGGLPSLHLWTGLKPPVQFYSSYWPLYYDEQRQRELGQALLAHQDACVVRRPDVLELWRQTGAMPEPILERLISERFQVAGSVAGIELLIPKPKRADLILTAFLAEMPRGAPAQLRDYVPLRLILPEMGGARLTRFALVSEETGMIVSDTEAAPGPRRLILADERGGELAAAGGRPPAIVLDRRRELLALVPPDIRRRRIDRVLVRCYDERGAVAARLPILRRSRAAD
jgi:hypothetical protein